MSEEIPEPRPKPRHRDIADAVQDVVKTVGDLAGGELEFRRTGHRPDPGMPSLSGTAGDALEAAVNYVAGMAHDELEFRATGRRPQPSLPEDELPRTPLPPGSALNRARTSAELGLPPDDSETPPRE